MIFELNISNGILPGKRFPAGLALTDMLLVGWGDCGESVWTSELPRELVSTGGELWATPSDIRARSLFTTSSSVVSFCESEISSFFGCSGLLAGDLVAVGDSNRFCSHFFVWEIDAITSLLSWPTIFSQVWTIEQFFITQRKLGLAFLPRSHHVTIAGFLGQTKLLILSHKMTVVWLVFLWILITVF